MIIHEHSTKTISSDEILGMLLLTLNYASKQNFIPRDPDGLSYNYLPLLKNSNEINLDKYEVIFLDEYIHQEPTYYKIPIIGIDSSIIPIAESSKGIVFGLKGTAICENQSSYSMLRIGPIPIYITKNIFKRILELMGINNIDVNYLNILNIKRFLIDIFEYVLIEKAITNFPNSIIILDGSLSSIYRRSLWLARNIYSLVKRKSCSIVAIPKKSVLMRRIPEVFGLVLSLGRPCAIKVSGKFLRDTINYHVYITLFKTTGIPFRVDISKYNSIGCENILHILALHKFTVNGYPEVLKEAHIFSKLSRNEIIVLRHLIERNGGKLISTFKLRDSLFGGFNMLGGGRDETL